MRKKLHLAFPYRQRFILHIDLESETYTSIPMEEEEAKSYLGGRLLGLMLWDRFAEYDQMGEECYERGNPVIFSPGAVVDTPLSYCNSFTVVTKSPVTGSLSVSSATSSLAGAIVGCGYAALVITGRSRKLCSFSIADGEVVFSDAEMYHNLTTIEVAKKVGKEHMVVIGPAGEHFVPFASLYANNQNITQGGVGCVCGMKNIKFFTLSPHSHGREAYDSHRLGLLNQSYLKDLGKTRMGKTIAQEGSIALLSKANHHGWAAIDTYSMRVDGRLWGLCTRSVPKGIPLDDPSFPICQDHAPLDLESAMALGSNLELFDSRSVQQVAHRCLENGLEVVSTGAVLAWARACRREGKLSFLPDLQRSTAVLYLRLLDAMAYRRGSGEQLGIGLRALVAQYGGAEHAFMVDGLPLPPYDYRALPVQALLVSIGRRSVVLGELLWGNHYHRGSERRLVSWALYVQKLTYACESAGLCPLVTLPGFNHRLFHFPHFSFARKNFSRLALLVSLGEGYEINAHTVRSYGDKALHLQATIDDRLLHREGRYGSLPDQLLVNGKSNFRSAQVVPLARLLDAYWSALGRK
ncbi:aldehyde ferredoxin oxidoreductase N-terminal domain-containing protein [uncultured Sphaerochaeta sp.]|uniref:aldehyde ferredoxin oxidoreductase N-terminal domain-containing protein n=1 Tax=uncultured Sphaerochaeta sp. TaxID=886478 RepID=UPI002A0A82E1|nr:aldehyde ferredoxin oxidoreductase N-terminal domain-containing protein [uncultured Sphaerochaeta sp.]